MRRQSPILVALLTLNAAATVDIPDAQHTLDGLWRGTFDINGAGVHDFTALYVNGTVSAYSISADTVYHGTVSGDATEHRSHMSLFLRGGAMFGAAHLHGEVLDQGRTIITRYLTTAKETGTLSLTYDPLFERPVAAGNLAGTWKHETPRFALELEMKTTGKLHGMDSIGCLYTGNIKKIRNNINAFKITLDVTSCSVAAGHYHGMAHAAKRAAEDVTLHLAFTSPRYGFYLPLRRAGNAEAAVLPSEAAPYYSRPHLMSRRGALGGGANAASRPVTTRH